MIENVDVFIEKIKSAKTIAISGHKNPDGDAICSALALMKIIELNFGKKPVVIYDGNIPRDFDNVPLRKQAVYWEQIPENSKYDLYILVDYGTRSHLGGAEKFVNNSDFVVEIDHHINDDLVGNLCFDNTSKAAAAQIVYDIVRAGNLEMDSDIKDLLMIAIITDTGHFKFVKNSDVFIDSAQLVDAGVNVTNLMNLLNNKDKKTVLVESATVSKAEFFMKNRLVVASIRKPDYKRLDGRGELVLSLLAQIHGVEFVVLLKEHQDNQIGISIRSKTVPINQVAESFGGGGHLYAAGAVIEDTFDNVYGKVVEAFKDM